MTTSTSTPHPTRMTGDRDVRSTFAVVRRLWLLCAAVSVLTLVAAAARGSRRAYARMRWVSTIAPIGVVVIVVAPDSGYPLWMKVEQAVVGVVVGAVAVLLNRRAVREAFALRR